MRAIPQKKLAKCLNLTAQSAIFARRIFAINEEWMNKLN
jgi:hypothetical protein